MCKNILLAREARASRAGAEGTPSAPTPRRPKTDLEALRDLDAILQTVVLLAAAGPGHGVHAHAGQERSHAAHPALQATVR